MTCKQLVVALGMVIAAWPLAARHQSTTSQAPAASADARYCMRVGPFTGSLIERVRCWTRDQWSAQGVDVDKEWAREGVRVIDR